MTTANSSSSTGDPAATPGDAANVAADLAAMPHLLIAGAK